MNELQLVGFYGVMAVALLHLVWNLFGKRYLFNRLAGARSKDPDVQQTLAARKRVGKADDEVAVAVFAALVVLQLTGAWGSHTDDTKSRLGELESRIDNLQSCCDAGPGKERTTHISDERKESNGR